MLLKVNITMIAPQIHPSLAGIKTSPKPTSSLDQACARLKSIGLRITQPRIAILETMIRLGQPASIEQIHSELAHTLLTSPVPWHLMDSSSRRVSP